MRLRVLCHKTDASIGVKAVKAEEATVETKGKWDLDDPEKDIAEKKDGKG